MSPSRSDSPRSISTVNATAVSGLEPVADIGERSARLGCEDCFEIDQLRSQYKDLCTMYQSLCEAYNQTRRDLDHHFHEVQSLSVAHDIEKTNRIQAESRCKGLQNALDIVEDSKQQSDNQCMAIISKLTDILYTSPTGNRVQGKLSL